MPLYEFYNEEIKEQYELMMTYDNKVKYLKKNPHIKEIIGAPKIVGGVGDRVKTDDGFKEVLSKSSNLACSPHVKTPLVFLCRLSTQATLYVYS